MIEILKILFNSLIDFITINMSENQVIQSFIFRSNSKIKQLINTTIIKITGILLISLSISHSYFYLAERYDTNQPFKLGLVGSSGIILLFLGFLAIFYSTREKKTIPVENSSEQSEVTNESGKIHPPVLEQAIAALIFDFIKEREERRDRDRDRDRDKDKDKDKNNPTVTENLIIQ